jgi:DNA-binding PadR family transcriptional regulator
MYELFILAFLMRWPTHGYMIAKIINDMIGPFAKVSNGRLYPLLAKLEEQGLIAVADDAPDGHHDRRQRPYKITAAGRQRFHRLMMDTASNPGEYQKLFWLKMPFFDFLEPAERLYLIEHYLAYCQAHVFHITAEMEDLAREVAQQRFMTSTQLEATLCAMRHFKSQWRLEFEHAKELREQEAEQADLTGNSGL